MEKVNTLQNRYLLAGAAVLLLILVNILASAYKQREVNLLFVSKAFEVLEQEVEKESVPLRAWAVDVLNEHSEIEIKDETRELLINEQLLISDDEG